MRISVSKNYIVLSFLLAISLMANGQRKINLEPGAGAIEGFKKDGISYTVIKDNVKFSHKGTLFFCDSAVMAKKTNYIEAYGHVKILDGDSITIIAQRLFYNGDTRIAQLRSGVVLTQLDRMQIFTDNLDYDRNTAIATYFKGGKIVDKTNTLTSTKGYYNTQTNVASFKTKVVGKNEDYLMNSDTLVYNTKSGIVYFVAPTELVDNEGAIFYHQGGQYNSREKRSSYLLGRVETEDYFLRGNDLRIDEIRGKYFVNGDVLMVSKGDNIFITGQRSIYNKRTSTTKIFDNPLMRMIINSDTLYLKADTLISIDSKYNSEKRLLAYNNVRVYKTDIQAVADSLAYGVADSTMYFFGAPVLWTDGNQLSADSINMIIRNKSIDVLNLINKAFVITEDSLENYNQIKGREMEATFKDNQLSKVSVYGNGESIFFMYDEKNHDLMGMNKIICSDITLIFEDRMLKDASFLVKPEGDFIPPHELKEEDRTLKDFAWHGSRRPILNDFKRPRILIDPPDKLEGGNIDLELPSKPKPTEKSKN